MNITHDQSLIGYDSRELIKRGYGCMAIDVLRLEFLYTPDKAQGSERMSPQQRNHIMKSVMDTIADRFPCYQYNVPREMKYHSQDWALFFWCREAAGDNDTAGDGRDYSYFMLIGIDHGNKQIKTAHCSPFTSGLKESDVLPFGKDILKFDGKYYQLTDQRIPYHRNKASDQRFFVLTLFAIAQELDIQNVDGRDTLRVQLAVGLPPAHYGAQHLEFSQYFLGRGVTNFTYQDKPYSILIDDVGCYPQSYAAAATIIRTLQDAPRALIVDIGGFTADYLQVKNGEGDLSICDSLENGVILLYNKTRSRVSAEQDILLDEAEIDAILMDRSAGTPPSLGDLVRRQAKEFVDDLLSTLRERGLELRSGPVVFVGGGSILLRRQIEASGKVRNPVFVDDIRANARGYELLYRVCHSGR